MNGHSLTEKGDWLGILTTLYSASMQARFLKSHGYVSIGWTDLKSYAGSFHPQDIRNVNIEMGSRQLMDYILSLQLDKKQPAGNTIHRFYRHAVHPLHWLKNISAWSSTLWFQLNPFAIGITWNFYPGWTLCSEYKDRSSIKLFLGSITATMGNRMSDWELLYVQFRKMCYWCKKAKI